MNTGEIPAPEAETKGSRVCPKIICLDEIDKMPPSIPGEVSQLHGNITLQLINEGYIGHVNESQTTD
jgi:hypothetical protein